MAPATRNLGPANEHAGLATRIRMQSHAAMGHTEPVTGNAEAVTCRKPVGSSDV